MNGWLVCWLVGWLLHWLSSSASTSDPPFSHCLVPHQFQGRLSFAVAFGSLVAYRSKGFCITLWEYTHWDRVILNHSESFPKGIILGCNTKALRTVGKSRVESPCSSQVTATNFTPSDHLLAVRDFAAKEGLTSDAGVVGVKGPVLIQHVCHSLDSGHLQSIFVNLVCSKQKARSKQAFKLDPQTTKKEGFHQPFRLQ